MDVESSDDKLYQKSRNSLSRFDCTKCHEENEDHEITKRFELSFGCKTCKKVFRKDLRDWDESDNFCPHCDTEFILPVVQENRNGPIGQVEVELDPELVDARITNTGIVMEM
eukprot:TRINITY_DN2610_c0_g1_i2.p1 TRINITY_DN2610_c0_g1~~TRINITY_DN2610_c0_g1_i2.p1  ORF type:complete len:112 (+),score=27.69 TRINITY_DN2610_c0_g1_i2:196-531(+)